MNVHDKNMQHVQYETSDVLVCVLYSVCRGKKCKMDLNPGPTSCMLSAYGVDVQSENKTREETCGLDQASSYWLEPYKHGNFDDYEVNCITGLHKDIVIGYWAPCVNGVPTLHAALYFKTPFEGNYRCLFNPQCRDGHFTSHTICYSMENLGDATIKNAGGKADPLSKFVCLVYLFILMIYLRDEYF